MSNKMQSFLSVVLIFVYATIGGVCGYLMGETIAAVSIGSIVGFALGIGAAAIATELYREW